MKKAQKPTESLLSRETQRLSRHASRSRAKGLKASLTLEQWIVTLDLFNWSCAYCGGDFEAMDHFIPESAGGGTTRENCRPSCQSCNAQKGNIDPRVGYRTGPWPWKRSWDVQDDQAKELIDELRSIQGNRTQAAFARDLDISESMLGRMYLGSRAPSRHVLGMLYRALPQLEAKILSALFHQDIGIEDARRER